MLESEIQSHVIAYLRRHKDILVIRHNPISPLGAGRFKKLAPMDRGVSDLIVVYKGIVAFIELKTSKGVQSIFQKAFERRASECGAAYGLCRSLTEVLAFLKSINIVLE